MDRPARLAVLLSGSGTTLQNLLDRIADGRLRATVAAVVGSRIEAFGLERARNAGIPALPIPRKQHSNSERFNDALHDALAPHAVDLVVLAGFLSLFQPRAYAGRVMNIHPALIPAFCGPGFYGHKVHEAVLAAGVKVSGCTVHFADDQYDHGPIILQGCVPVLEDDTPDSLAARVQTLESELYPQAIQLWIEDRLRIDAGRVRILPPPA
ncbi:MAG: phosphoribosylglycinamide formyltransferase [bacterium]